MSSIEKQTVDILPAIPSVEIVKAAFAQAGAIDDLIKKIEDEVAGHDPDLTTAKGREAIASLAYKVARSKTFIDEAGKELVEADTKRIALVDKQRKAARDALDALKEKIYQPLANWKAAEQAKIDAIKARVQEMRDLAVVTPESTSDDLKECLAELKAFVLDESFGDQIADAAQAKDSGIATLERAIEAAAKREAEAAELARLRAEKEARDKADAEAKKAAEIAAKAEAAAKKAAQDEIDRANAARLAAEQAAKAAQFDKAEAERKAIVAAEQAEKARIEAVAAEKARAEREAALQAEADAARAADEQNRADKHAAIRAELAKYIRVEANIDMVLKLIIDGHLPFVKVEY